MSGSEVTTPLAAPAGLPGPEHPADSLFHRLGGHLSFNEDRFFLILSIFIGIFAGLAVVCFHVTIEWVRLFLLGSSVAPSPLRGFLAPSITGLVIGALVMTVFRGARGSGLNQTKAALYISDGYISFRTVIGKFVAASLAIGSGHSLGPEDPSLQIGAGIASALGRRLKLTRKKLRLLAPVGAAAGLAAAFNAPISAVLFVIEEVIGHWSAGILGAIVLAAVSSVVTMRWFLGAAPLFHIPATGVIRWQELAAYAVLGIFGGFASVAFSYAIGGIRPRLRKLPRWTACVQPAVAGLIIGGIAFIGFPQVMGAGYYFIDQAMHDQFTWQVLGILAALKIVATTLSFTSGTPGGMFAPTLFIGAMLGGAVGTVERLFFPQLTGSVATYALVGMGVLFAGFLRAPITSVFMAMEVSGDYSIILPVLVANMFSYVIARRLQETPILEVLTRQDGLNLPALEEEREQGTPRVEDAMRKPKENPLDGNMTVTQAMTLATMEAGRSLLVTRSSTHSLYLVTSGEIQHLSRAGRGEEALNAAFPDRVVPCLFPDQDLDIALRYAQEWKLVPVVSRADSTRIHGVLDLADVLKVYRHSRSGETVW